MKETPEMIGEEGLGAYLRRKRIESGISLQEVFERTRIQKGCLERIEAEEFDRLPPIPIARGFVRAYADCIGVDANEAVTQFNRAVGGSDQRQIEALPNTGLVMSGPAERRREARRRRLLRPVYAAIVLLLAGAALMWFHGERVRAWIDAGDLPGRHFAVTPPAIRTLPLTNGTLDADSATGASPGRFALEDPSGGAGSRNEKKEEHPPPNSAGGKASPEISSSSDEISGAGPRTRGGVMAQGRLLASADLTTTDGTLGSGDGAAPAAVESGSGRGAVAPRATGDKGDKGKIPLVLRIFALEDTWIRVVVDGRSKEELFLAAGNAKNWKGIDRFVVTVGNAIGTKVSLNGTDISLPQSSSNVVRDFVIGESHLN